MEKFKGFYKKYKKYVKYILIVFFAYLIILECYHSYEDEKIKDVPYSEFMQMVKEGKVDTVYYSTSEEKMTFTLFNEDTKNMTEKQREDYKYDVKDYRRTYYPAYEDFRKEMLENNIHMVVTTSSVLFTLISGLATVAFPIIWLLLIFNIMQKQLKGVDKNTLIQTSDVKFSDVIGQDEVIEDIKFVTELIKDPNKGDDIGAKVPKGMLFSGEPGTGKTLIAKAIAGEAGVPFLYMNASSFIEMYVGVGAKRVRELFSVAKEHTPCIVFIDEIDAVGQKRDSRGSNSENDQTINALLQEMDGFSGREGIFVIAATNRPDKLDKALIRAGRFDRQITINPPKDWRVRKQLFEYYLKDFKLSDDVNVENLSRQTVGFTGADISAVCNEAGIVAMMNEKPYVDNASIEEAIDKKIFNGNRSNDDSHKDDKKIVAYHEAGHAVVTYLLNQQIARATIVGTTSGVGGFVMQSESDSYFTTDVELKNQVMIAFGGRASEEIKFKSVTTGASSDISQATNIMIKYVERYGFDRDFGMLDMSILREQALINSDDIAKRLSEMSKIVYKDTFDMLNSNYELVEVLANKLLEEETLSGDEIKELLDEIKEG